ncbi:30S ribosomal protein S20 [Candidatus Gracilibacteria bacterium]|nr:30S ribosomal protein S20 [Candidatus Gracilibacteria bacterium]
MPIIKSAIKRVRQEATRQKRNTLTKDAYKGLIKEFSLLITDKKIEEAQKLFPTVQKAIDMAVKKNLLNSNTASRKKSHLSKQISVKKTA